MDLERAQKIASEVVTRLTPYCDRIEVAGSIRRKKSRVNDVDIVLIPSDLWNLTHEIMGLGPAKVSGTKIQRVNCNGTQIDIYFADEDTWATLLLIRTGSAENNIYLASLAKRKGWRLAASGDGLFNEEGQRIAGESELSIYQALGVRWQWPWERE